MSCNCKKCQDHPYQPGVRVDWNGHFGIVVENYKLPGDICIDWDSGCKSSYDLCFLEDEEVKVIREIECRRPKTIEDMQEDAADKRLYGNK